MSVSVDEKAGWSSWCRYGDHASCAKWVAGGNCAWPGHAEDAARPAPKPRKPKAPRLAPPPSPEPVSAHPYRDEDGRLDVAAYCRHLDDRANAGDRLPPVSAKPNPIRRSGEQ